MQGEQAGRVQAGMYDVGGQALRAPRPGYWRQQTQVMAALTRVAQWKDRKKNLSGGAFNWDKAVGAG